MSKKKKKINNTAEERKGVVTETEVSLDELDKFEPDVKERPWDHPSSLHSFLSVLLFF